MMHIPWLEPQSVRAFLAASDTLNFTRAARLAFMTQSGISQHVARLEKELGVKLFSRRAGAVMLTSAGETLRGYLVRASDELTGLRATLREEVDTGTVSYAMPASCLLSPHFHSLLQERAQHFPRVQLRVSVCENQQVIERLLDERIDFGFVTSPCSQAGVATEKFCRERYVLFGPAGGLHKIATAEDLKTLPMVHYPGADIALDAWCEANFPKARASFHRLSVVGEINELAGVLSFLKEGVGYAVVAEHCVRDLVTDGVLEKVAGKNKPADNQVLIVTRKDRPQARSVAAVLDAFRRIIAQKTESAISGPCPISTPRKLGRLPDFRSSKVTTASQTGGP
jgi:LysR family transcriptional regulator, transcriptional activator of the cysJI operon